MRSYFILHSHIRVPFSHTPAFHTDGRLNLNRVWKRAFELIEFDKCQLRLAPIDLLREVPAAGREARNPGGSLVVPERYLVARSTQEARVDQI